MEFLYNIRYETSFLEDIQILSKTVSKIKLIKIMKLFNLKKSILKEFPRIYQKVQCNALPNREYRKIVLDQYIVIYEITSNEISFQKIYPQKNNYINKIKLLHK